MAKKPARPVGITADPSKFNEAIRAFRRKLPMSDKAWRALSEAEREYAFMVSHVAQADVIADVWEAIDRAVRDGTTLQEFRVEVAEKLASSWGGEKPGRVETIFRTNVQKAYSEGRYQTYSAPAVRKSHPYLRYDAVLDERTAADCESLDGTILRQDDPFWDRNTPPRHFNCRCTVTAITEDDADEEGIDDDPPDVDTADGFGIPPGDSGADWSPEPADYPDEIAAILNVRLAG